MTIDDYMRLPWRTYFENDMAGDKPCVVGYNPELLGCMAMGDTWQEANDNLKEVRRDYLATLLKRGWPIDAPKPLSPPTIWIQQ